MATFFRIFVVCLLVGAGAQAQTRSHTVRVGYGVASVQREFNGFFKGLFTGIDWTRNRGREFGPLAASYSYAVTPNFEVGLALSYTQATLQGRHFQPDQPDPTAPALDYDKVIAQEKSRFYAMMPIVQYNWLHTHKLKLYSGVALGRHFRKIDSWQEDREPRSETVHRAAFHLNAIGFQYGKRVAGYAEFGLGFHGVLNGGVALTW
ncbi:hypothetical protein [Rufibacter psychrotolerans]|uniref:hypothetical protein n=1 Tax=Rufibacter psychrotolerans TaxID=2812556 RepID=UPI0019679E08|nr:hypothetical protein [Rufibacter sp. SYSU D00308]